MQLVSRDFKDSHHLPIGRRRGARSVSLGVATAIAASALFWSATSSAEPTPKEAASAHYQAGVRLYEDEDFASALVEFRRAYEIQPNWAVLFNIGQSYFAMKDYARAVPILQTYRAEGGSRVPADRRELVDRELRDLEFRTGRVRIESDVTPAEAFIDDVAVPKLGEPTLVNVGRHRLRVVADGRTPFVQEIEVTGNEDVRVQATLVLAGSPKATPSPTTATSTDAPPKPGSIVPAVVALGLGTAFVGVGAVFGVSALSTKSDLDAQCPAAGSCPPSAQDRIDTLSSSATLSTIGFAAGAVALGVGAYLLLTRHPAPASTSGSAALSVRFQTTGVGGTF